MMIKAYMSSFELDGAKQLAKVRDPAFWTYAAVRWHTRYNKFVPFHEGILADTVVIKGKRGVGEITHTAPYAHYQYEGEAYGPSFPVYQNGKIVGYRSLKHKSKHPTGKSLKYKRDRHPNATSHWDQAARSTELPGLIRDLQDYVKRRI